MKLQRMIGMAAFLPALVFIVWLPLGILHVVPLVLELPGESSLRVHAGAAVGFLMVAAWGFWDG